MPALVQNAELSMMYRCATDLEAIHCSALRRLLELISDVSMCRLLERTDTGLVSISRSFQELVLEEGRALMTAKCQDLVADARERDQVKKGPTSRTKEMINPVHSTCMSSL